MFDITNETWENNGAEVVVINGTKWLNEKNLEKGLDHSALKKTATKYLLKYRKHGRELVDQQKKYPNRIFCMNI